MIDKPIHITDSEFEEKVLKSELPVIVDFWAEWCGPCKMIAPILEKIAKEQEGKLIIAKLNVDEYNERAIQYGVQGIPTMMFFYNNKIVYRQVGALPESILRKVIEQFLDTVEKIPLDKS